MIEFDELSIGDIIGKGSFSVVHHGEWKGKDVALKRVWVPPEIGYKQVMNSKEVSIMRSTQTSNINTV